MEAWLTRIPEPFGTLVNYTLVFVFLSFLFVLPLVTFTVLIERKVIGFMQHRFGPNRVGPRGWLQTIADAIKLIQKEDITPRLADPIPFWLAPIITFLPALIGFAVIGMGGLWADDLVWVGNRQFRDFKMWAPVDLDVSIVFLLAISSITAVGIFMAGWASNNKYSLFGSMRGMAQVISYEVPMILALMAVVVATGTMSLKGIALRQGPQWDYERRDMAVRALYYENPGINAADLSQAFAAELEVGEGANGEATPVARVRERGGQYLVLVGTGTEYAGENGAALRAAAERILPANPAVLEVVPGPVPVDWGPKPVSGGIPFVVPMFLGFLIYFITATAETNRSPFDLPEAESELVSGFHTEYTGMKFALFFLGEYANMILVSSIATICFLGAWWVPAFMSPVAERWPVLYFISYFLKMYFLIYVMIWFRSTFPRLRPDQLMDLAWKWLIPLSMVNLLVVAYFQFADWDWQRLLQTNYQIWYLNVLAGLRWPVVRALFAAIMLPLVPDMFGANFPKVRRYLVPFLWVFSIAFVLEDGIGTLLGNRYLHVLVMDIIWILCAYWFGMSLVTLADRYPTQQRTLRFALFMLMAIIPMASLTGLNAATNPGLAAGLAWVQRILWWLVLVPTIAALYQIATTKVPEARIPVLANDAAGGFIP
ncbi:MAG TPA: complex I subunit 1 family protein, partial [bacterium]|nr:complex I subunit 1 family protein [bacterium]